MAAQTAEASGDRCLLEVDAVCAVGDGPAMCCWRREVLLLPDMALRAWTEDPRRSETPAINAANGQVLR